MLVKVVGSRQQNDWQRFRQVCLDVCQKVDALELFLALRHLLTSQSTSLENAMDTVQFEMAQSERSKELLLDILRPCFFDFEEWPVELIEGAIA